MTERVWAVALIGAALAAFPCSSAAENYRWVDAHGGVHYADRPPKPEDAGALAPPTAAAAQPVAPPVAPARTGPVTVEELLELSGMRAQLVGIASRLGGELRPAKGQLNPRDEAAVDRILGGALHHEKIYTLMRGELRRDVDRAKLEATVEWLRSPIARKIVALEVASSETGTDQKVAAYAAGLKASPPPGQRVELLQKLDWIAGTTETSTDITAAITRSVTKAVSSVSPPAQKLRPGQIESRVAEIRNRTGELLRQVQLVTMLYAYESLEDAELGEYVRFSASDAGRWYNGRMHKALVSAVVTVVERTVVELVRAVPLERWTRVLEPASRKEK